MGLPATLSVTINFTDGPGFGIPLVLDSLIDGILDSNTLGASGAATLIVDFAASTTQIAIRRGRNILQDTYDTGQATVKILDPNGYFDPQNVSSPLYGYVQPGRKLRISATYSGTVYYLFSGYTSEYRYSYPVGQDIAYVTVSAFDAFKIFNTSAVTTVTGASAGQSAGTRIGKILDMIGWPSSMRDIDTGTTPTLQADPGTSRTALSALKTVEATEYGAFYMSPSGDAVFQDRAFTAASIGGAATVFDQSGGINYANLKFALDDKQIYNQANITRLNGTLQTASDATSITTYFAHTVTMDNLLMENDSDALNLAQAYVASRKDTSLRIDAITLDLCTPSYSAGVIAGLDLDYFDVITVTNLQPSGSTITKTLQVQGVSHDITPNSWITTFNTMEPIIDAFILDSALYGILDTSVLSY